MYKSYDDLPLMLYLIHRIENSDGKHWGAFYLWIENETLARQYASYYHILETIVSGDEPLVEGVAGLPDLF